MTSILAVNDDGQPRTSLNVADQALPGCRVRESTDLSHVMLFLAGAIWQTLEAMELVRYRSHGLWCTQHSVHHQASTVVKAVIQ